MDQTTPNPAANLDHQDLSAVRAQGLSLAGAVLRGADVAGLEIDAPWLLERPDPLVVNGVDVSPYVERTLNERFPGRELRRAADADGLRAAWAAVEQAWATAVVRAEGMPSGTVDASVAGEWSFAQTLRHLVMATDTWLGRAVLREEQPYHPAGLPDDSVADDGKDTSVWLAEVPWEDVRAARTERQGMVRDFLAGATDEVLAEPRSNPHAPQYDETVLSCLRTILEEEWEHLRFATRDLDALAEGATTGS